MKPLDPVTFATLLALAASAGAAPPRDANRDGDPAAIARWAANAGDARSVDERGERPASHGRRGRPRCRHPWRWIALFAGVLGERRHRSNRSVRQSRDEPRFSGACAHRTSPNRKGERQGSRREAADGPPGVTQRSADPSLGRRGLFRLIPPRTIHQRGRGYKERSRFSCRLPARVSLNRHIVVRKEASGCIEKFSLEPAEVAAPGRRARSHP